MQRAYPQVVLSARPKAALTVWHCRHASSAAELQNILSNNRQWAESQVAKDPNFFKKLVSFQVEGRGRLLRPGC